MAAAKVAAAYGYQALTKALQDTARRGQPLLPCPRDPGSRIACDTDSHHAMSAATLASSNSWSTPAGDAP